MESKELERQRCFLKDTIRKSIDFRNTDQNRGLPPPPIEKPCRPGSTFSDLPGPGEWRSIASTDLRIAIGNRRSHRVFRKQPLSMDELAFLLWSTQGIRDKADHGHAYRTVPSAGCRHAFETYLAVFDVGGLAPGLYRYLPLSHRLVSCFSDTKLQARLVTATLGQAFSGRSAVTFIWTAIPYRMEWRYGLAAHKVMALDAGHVCQNLYLACEAIGAGTCAIAAYDQEGMDELLGLDGQEEFTIYLAPVGKT